MLALKRKRLCSCRFAVASAGHQRLLMMQLLMLSLWAGFALVRLAVRLAACFVLQALV